MRRKALQLYTSGLTLSQERNYEHVIAELQKAKDTFRKLDAQGHPFPAPVSNGVSGLANTLAAPGHCYEKVGDYEHALTCYETSFINAPFEKKMSFHAFRESLRQNMRVCYEKKQAPCDEETLRTLLSQYAEIDISFLFPFSPNQEFIPLVRLYELAPERYPQAKDFYQQVKEKNSMIRRNHGRADESTMVKMAFCI